MSESILAVRPIRPILYTFGGVPRCRLTTWVSKKFNGRIEGFRHYVGRTEKWQLWCIATWGLLTSRQPFWAFITRLMMYQRVKFQHNRAMQDWVIDDFPSPFFQIMAILSAPVLGVGERPRHTPSLERTWANHRRSKCMLYISDILIHVETRAPQRRLGSKISDFFTPVKLGEGSVRREVLESIFQALPMTQSLRRLGDSTHFSDPF